jgi:anhydro-N-acetylmuramic acid kinase
MSDYYIGLLSGTSMDAIDAAIIDFGQEAPKLIATHALAIPEEVKRKIRSLCFPGDNEINRLGKLDRELGKLFANAVLTVCGQANIKPEQIKAIGSHGQTIRHMPQGENGFTLQIADPNTIAAMTGITTIADFRRKDIALGGQGAPLAPAFHQHLFRNEDNNVFVINIGGIANLTYLPKDPNKEVIGFDTGPGNCLMDAWCQKHFDCDFDKNGDLARQGLLNEQLLDRLLKDGYFQRALPKSTGLEYFNLTWLEKHASTLDNKSVLRTLLELSAKTITNEILKINPQASIIYLCGGGALNTFLVERLDHHLPQHHIKLTDDKGIPATWLEAMLFAWLAKQHLKRKSGNLPSVTGAKQQTILGSSYI